MTPACEFLVGRRKKSSKKLRSRSEQPALPIMSLEEKLDKIRSQPKLQSQQQVFCTNL